MKARTVLWKVGLVAFALVVAPAYLSAEVRIFDGFGDADLNNDGTMLGREDGDIDRDGVIGSSYEPPEFVGSTVTEISSALDTTDVGAKWLFSRGWTSSPSPPPIVEFQPKANIKIMDDSAGAMPDATHPTYPVPSLDTGYAMAWDSKGRGSSATAFFGENIALGPEVGDQVKVSFDFRTWISGPNMNGETPPRVASLRFGMFQDTDNQIGMTNMFAGMPDVITGLPTPAVWGEEGGHFRGDLSTVGATEDRGWYGAIDLGRTDFAGVPGFDPADFGGTGARINEETNEVTSGGKFLEGSDNDFVAKTDELNPTFTALDVTKAYNLALTLERATDTDPGDTIKAIFTVKELSSGMTWTLEGTEPLFRTDSMGMLVEDGISSDNWDYFGIRNTTPLDSDGDDFDLIIDNFKLELFGSNASGGPDINGDGDIDCLDVDSLVAAIAGGSMDPTYDLNGDTLVNGGDLTEWLALAGAELNDNGNPFLPGDATLDGTVDGGDFLIWNTVKFTDGNGWCGGDFNADGTTDGGDFLIWNNFKFQSSDSVSAVPEPASVSLLAILAACGCWLRKRT